MSNKINITGLTGIKEVAPGDDIAKLIDHALAANEIALRDKDILVLAQKIISKAENRFVDPAEVQPSENAIIIAKNMINKAPEEVQVILDESIDIIRNTKHVLITEHKIGLIMANAGVDKSNVEKGKYLLLPKDPDRSAAEIRNYFKEKYGIEMAVIISDTVGRPWRNGQTNIAIGVAGMIPLFDYANTYDTFGNSLKVTNIAQADEIASAAELVMGKAESIPAAVVRGVHYQVGEGSVKDLIRAKKDDLFR